MGLEVNFEMPDWVFAGLMKGSLVRRGGIIQGAAGTANAGQVMLWLRETSPRPLAPTELKPSLGGFGTSFGYVSSIASVVNLGATVFLGLETLRRLDAIDAKLDRLGWVVEYGFKATLNALEHIERHHELEIVAELKTAAQLAWDVQLHSPTDGTRQTHLAQALSLATKSTNLLLFKLVQQTEDPSAVLDTDGGRARIALSGRLIPTLQRIRLAAFAIALRARISAESLAPAAVANGIHDGLGTLQSVLRRIGDAFFESKTGNVVYDDLMNKKWAGTIPYSRLQMWANRFDGHACPGGDILTRLQNHNSKTSLTRIDEDIKWESDALDKFPLFADLLDGAWEDVERLDGHLAEYQNMAELDISIEEYRDRMKIELPRNDVPHHLIFVRPSNV